MITNLIENNNSKYGYNRKIYTNKYISYNPSFGNSVSLPETFINRLIESCIKKLGMVKKKLNNRIKTREKNNVINSFYQKIINVDEASPEYIKHLYGYAKSFGKSKEVEINLESKRILNIVNSDEACIFIINHDDRKNDPAMLGIFNTLLNGAYIKAGKATSCPRPKIIINEDILLSMDEKRRAILEKFGAIGIDASLFNANAVNNAKKVLPVMTAFSKDKVHIFIFPEGKMSRFKDLDLKYKFQTGIAEIVKTVAGAKKNVKVVPIGFAYNEKSKQFLGGIHIGEPVYFKKQGQNFLFSNGNMDSNFTSKNYVDLFKNSEKSEDGFRTITSHGTPVKGKVLPDYIAGVLCENLRICKEEAKRQLPQDSLRDKIIKL